MQHLGMPLHREHVATIDLNCFNRVVVEPSNRSSDNGDTIPDGVNRLMMQAVDRDPRSVHLRADGLWGERNIMEEVIDWEVVATMLGHVLMNAPTVMNVDELESSADTKHGNLCGVGGVEHCKLERVANGFERREFG